MSGSISVRWVLACVAGSLTFELARAYVPITRPGSPYIYKWETSVIAFQVKLPTWTDLSDGQSRGSNVTQAMALWNTHLGSVQFTSETAVPGPATFSNGINEIALESTIDGDGFPAGVLAVTLNQGGTNATAESDVIFNANYHWDSYRGPTRSPRPDIFRVAIHELGHVLGLDHPDEHGQHGMPAIMNSHISEVDTLLSDDIAGGQKLYGAPGFRPTNDNFADASPVVTGYGQSARVEGTNIAAKKENGEPDHAGSISARSVWWKWEAPAEPVRVTFTTMGSNFDTVLAVYTGLALPELRQIAANDDVTPGEVRTSTVTFDTEARKTYFIGVDGWADADDQALGHTGAIMLNLNYIPVPIAPTFSMHPENKEVEQDTVASFEVRASATPYPAYLWQRRSSDGVWTDLVDDSVYRGTTWSNLSVNATLSMDGQQFRCVVRNTEGTAISHPATLTVRPLALPVFVTQPDGGVRYEGMSFGFGVEAMGGFPRYQWFRDGLALPGEVSRWSNRFEVWDARVGHSGVYHAVATNAVGSTESRKVRLAVMPVTGVVSVRAVERRTMFTRADGSRWRMGIIFPHGALMGSPWPFSSVMEEANTPAAAMGDSHELSVRPDGTLWVSGDNEHGQLGLGDNKGRYASAYLTSDVIAAAAGCYSSYFIKRDGSLWGMGDNGLGQLGVPWADDAAPGPVSDCYLPVRIAEGVVAVSAYFQHVLFIKSDGSLWAMGANVAGALGDGTTTSRIAPVRVAENVASISAGQTSSLFVKHDGTAWAMGGNTSGQLGDGTIIDRLAPVQVMRDVLAVSAGLDHSLFLKTDGSLWIAGNVDSQFDRPDSSMAKTPIQVATNVTTMAAGSRCSFFVKADGLWTTGIEEDGKLGLGGGMLLWSQRQRIQTPRNIANGLLVLPKAVTSVEAPITSNSRIFLRWKPARDATRYEVWRNTTNSIATATRIAANVVNALYYDFTAATGVSYFYWVRPINPAGAGAFGASVQAGGNAVVGLPPSGSAPYVGQQVSLSVASRVDGTTFQWRRNGVALPGATQSSLLIADLEPGEVGLYDALLSSAGTTSASSAAIVGVASINKVSGHGAEIGANIVHANGNIYDQVLLQGAAATLTADRGQIVRMSYVDLSDDIVQVEFSGAGTLTLTLEGATGPATAVNYNQPSVSYMKGHAAIIVTGADETTNLSVFSVGRLTAVNQALFRDDVSYDGMADLAFIAISSANGLFGGLRTGNVSYFGTRGVTGIYAPSVQFQGPVYLGDISATDAAVPTLLMGGASEVRIAGGDLLQTNGALVQVGGFSTLRVTAGTNSHGVPQPVQPLRAELEPGDVGVTSDAAPR